ncbi:putative RabGAP/TBC domaincontaining protein [Phytophthora cinnamomi]|uniref:putative RabGAP/TBC domaincontaining protein n=1 Tax=Phytophthora cinnamomi TaxID=4785 RepID=UPI00355A3682|nr:putative RabGAP/TBC domaincontaining protein [Phytophthora cinnamomi]
MKSPPHSGATSAHTGCDSQHRTASSQLPPPAELSIFPAFTPDPIRLAELKGSSPYSPPVSPRGAETREIYASLSKGQAFFELLEARGLSLVPASGNSGDEDPTNDGGVDVVRCVDGRRRTLLHQACRCGNVQVAKCLLFHGANASARCRDGRTPFHNAAASTSTTALGLMKLLFEHDPTGITAVDANGSHVLHLAAIHASTDTRLWETLKPMYFHLEHLQQAQEHHQPCLLRSCQLRIYCIGNRSACYCSLMRVSIGYVD